MYQTPTTDEEKDHQPTPYVPKGETKEQGLTPAFLGRHQRQ
jgi:hypothetical protein